VDEEIANNIEGSFTTYAFSGEEEYYHDLQMSKYGITTKRAGWDCLRHYEIAANGAVICFRNLQEKPVLCAPHGLIAGENCISYTSYEDLMNKIELISEDEYLRLQEESMNWVKQNTTVKRVEQLL
jgi:hypothetical protein